MKTSASELTRAILSRECPFCEGDKQSGCCFCDRCHGKLPAGTKAKLKNGLRSLSEGIMAGIKFLENRA